MTDITVENPVEIPAEVDVTDKPRKTPKNKLKNLTLNTILDHACGNPDDFKRFSEWQDEEQKRRDEATEETPYKPQSYQGWMRYEITLHCVSFTVIAKKHSNGGYQIKDYIVLDH